jgi:hypothetical protein
MFLDVKMPEAYIPAGRTFLDPGADMTGAYTPGVHRAYIMPRAHINR